MTQFLILAHGAGIVRIFAGTVCGLPLAIIAILTAAIGRDRKRPWLTSFSWWLGWFALTWNVGWCALILVKDGMPFEFYPHWFCSYGNVLEYLMFFGPATFLSACAILIAGRERRRLKVVGPTPPKCAKCGYLLTGLTKARCPECGTPFDPLLLKTGGKSADELDTR